MAEFDRPLSVAMLALGGQGGGVLTTWLVELAEANGYLAQSTYVAGVAQRTGATVYCVEMYPAARAEAEGREPVFTPYPVPGDVDLVVAGEMAETGRAILKGFVTPNVTTLLASSHRVYSIDEKSAPDDGIRDQAPVAEIAAKAARRFVCFDMQALAVDTGSVISSVMFGAIAASGALPFERAAFEATIRNGGKAVESNLRGFAAGFEHASASAKPADDADVAAAKASGANGAALAARIDAELPAAVADMALHGALRCLEYQDAAYAGDYLDSLARVAAADNAAGGWQLTLEVARQLALQMCYEDVVRVAELKTRAARFQRIREHVAAADGQPLRVVEFFHPRFEEMCDLLPRRLGRRLHDSARARRWLAPVFKRGRNVTTTSVSGFLLLHGIAKLRRMRRSSFRFERQQRFIDEWLADVTARAATRYDAAIELARAVESVRGYGDTYDRGLARYREQR